MFKFINILLMPGILISLVACSNDNPIVPEIDYEPEVVVFGLLLLTDRDQGQQKTIRIERSYEITEKVPDYSDGRAIKDALVFVETENQRVQFEHDFASAYSDKNNELQLLPGERYKLDITLKDGQKITSECLMPDRPAIVSPTLTEPVQAFEPLLVKWQEAEFAHRYQIAVEADNDGFQFSTFSASDQEEIYAFIFARPNIYYFKVASLDQNYYDYLRSRSNRQPISHINGALGVFGAIAYDRGSFRALP